MIMGFRFQRRLNLSHGFGLNISKSGISPSLRTRGGSIGTKGYSIRTGISGLSYRARFGKKDAGSGVLVGMMMLVFALFATALALIPPLVRIVVSLLQILWAIGAWIVGTLSDLVSWAINRHQLPTAAAASTPVLAKPAGLPVVARTPIHWVILPPDPAKKNKVSLIGECVCRQTIQYDDDWPLDHNVTCAHCGTDLGTYAEIKVEAEAFVHEFLRN
jgi:hypothetical protein